MAEIDGGALSFKSVMDNDQMNTAIEETLRRVQGLSDGTVAGGKKMDTAFDTTAESIRAALGQIGTACETHEKELASLEAEYQRLGQKASAAFMAGRDDEYYAITKQQTAVKGEITMRERLLQELRGQSDALEENATKIEENRQKTESAAAAHVSFRTRLREVREALAEMEQAGLRGTAGYTQLQQEAGRLTDAMGDAQAQARILAHDNAGLQGVISAVNGVAGAMSVGTGAMQLFGNENEDLQKAMVKVQSVMAISMGMQQVLNTLNKDSAASLGLVGGLKQWWAGVVEKAAIAETAETVATTANTAAQGAQATATGAATTSKVADTVATGAQATAATAGTVANIGLAGAFRLVGVAIKSIPVFGWILAGISGLIALYQVFSSKAREAKKAQEEFSKAMIDGCYKPIGTIQELSAKYSELGNNLEAKKKFIEQNKKSFDELGVSVNDVTDAENLLINNKDAFIAAQIAKAKAMVYTQQAMEETKKLIEAQQKLDSTPKAYVSKKGEYTDGYGVKRKGTVMVKDSDWQEAENAVNDSQTKINNLLENARKAEKEGFDKLKSAGIDGANTYKAGTVGAIEQAIQAKQAALKLLTNNEDYKKGLEEIKKLEKQKESITGKTTKGGGSGSSNSNSSKDPFLDKLEKQKKEYTRFMKWINSGDETIAKAANTEFAALLKEGATYIDYLKKQRDEILSVDISERSKAQNKQLRTLNDQIAEETKKTVLEAFNEELSDQLNNAKTTLEILNVIAQKRKELANDGTDVDNEKKETLDDAEKDAVKKQKEETDALLEEYSSYLDKKLKLEQDFTNDLQLLEKRREEATTDTERSKVDQAIANRTQQYQKDSKGSGDANYDELLTTYATFEQKKQAIIDEYDEKRKVAQEHNNTQLIEKLNEAQAKAMSALASDELMGTDVWANLFGNLDELTAQQITTLVNEIESKFDTLSGVFNPIDLTNVRNKLNEAKAVLVQDNPFKQLGISLKAIFSDAGEDSKDSANKVKKNWKNLATSTEKCFEFVNDAVGSCDFLKDAIGDVGATAISSMATCAAVAISVATAIKTAEKASVVLAIISAALAVCQAVANVVKSIFGNQDAKIEKNIQKHADAVRDLESAYNQLSWTIDKALGSVVYKNQQAAIANMEAQKAHLKQMWQDEESKKKTDSGKVADYKEQYAQLERDIQDMMDEISNDIVNTDAKTFASDLGDALVKAFGKGEDAASAFEETVNDVMKNAVLNQLKKKFLETQLQGALDGLEKSMGYWNGDDFIFDGLTDSEIAAFKDKVSAISNNFNQALGIYTDLFKDIADVDEDSTLTGAVKGVSEETASLIGGQMNAIRINQMEVAAILRQQLAVLSTIANNTSYNFHLAKLERIVSLLENVQSGNSLRSQGLS